MNWDILTAVFIGTFAGWFAGFFIGRMRVKFLENLQEDFVSQNTQIN